MYSTRRIDSLIIHCAATPNGRWTSVLDINHWHQQAGFARAPSTEDARKWNLGLGHIGYHWVIYTNGGLATGRHESEVGAHARGHNARSLSICLIGTDKFTPPTMGPTGAAGAAPVPSAWHPSATRQRAEQLARGVRAPRHRRQKALPRL